jgi:hypothetical protein
MATLPPRILHPGVAAHPKANLNAMPNAADYGPSSHLAPQFARGTANSVVVRGIGGQRGRAESPANLTIGGGGLPPGLATVQNTAGMWIDLDAANRYSRIS